MKLDIYFKNVGQGDTIFLHWDNDQKFGLIDCNLVDNEIDGIIDHIKTYKIRHFEFMVMSHPHADHFSGFLKLFNYCQANQITVQKFFHTATFDPEQLGVLFNKELSKKEHYKHVTSTVNRKRHKKMLWKLYKTLDQQHQLNSGGFIKDDVYVIGNDYELPLNDVFSMKFLAPYNYDELKKYIRGTFNVGAEEQFQLTRKSENNPMANYLSTLIQIGSRYGPGLILLSSDITSYTLERIFGNEAKFNALKQRRLIAAQIPHHGSDKNHFPLFWQNLNDVKQAHFVISVGVGYGHPNVEVVNFFRNQSNSLHATNYVGGFKVKHKNHAETDTGHGTLIDAVLSMPGVLPESVKEQQQDPGHIICGEKHLSVQIAEGVLQCKMV